MMSLTPDSTIQFSAGTQGIDGTHGIDAPNKCSVVLVAGDALNDFDNVKKTVDSVKNQLELIPTMMILFVDDPNIFLNLSTHAMTPAMVRCHSTDTVNIVIVCHRCGWISTSCLTVTICRLEQS